MMKAQTEELIAPQYSLVKRYGVLAFMFFLCKGLLWVIMPIALAYFGINSN